MLQAKTGHVLFPKKFIEETLKEALDGVWILLESIHKVIPPIAIGCHYSTKIVLFLYILGLPKKVI